jgi:transcriptional regulator with XRE-family HTH domain
MLSKFGQFVRALRLQKNMLMSHMAEELGCSPSYLSAVEFGRRPVPDTWISKIADILDLDEKSTQAMAEAASSASSKSRGQVTVSLDDLTPFQEEVALQFARKISHLTNDELEKIRAQLLEDRAGEQNWRRSST